MIVEEGKPRDVLVNPKKERTRQFLTRYLSTHPGAKTIQSVERKAPSDVKKA